MKSLLLVSTVLLALASAVASAGSVPAGSYKGMPFYGFGGPGQNPMQPENPIVGILTTPNPHDMGPNFNKESCPTYIQQTYVDWLAQAGVRSVPLDYDMPLDEMGSFLDNLNGALFTGGGMDIAATHGKAHTFYQAAEFVVNYTMAANAKDDKFVLWGTCQGFQLISVASAMDQSVLQCDYKGVEPAMLPLTMVEANKTSGQLNSNSSRFLEPAFMPESSALTYTDMTQFNSTANLHGCGVTPDTFATNKRLKELYQVISTNVDTTGRPFVSTIEHKHAEIYATQWHPEGAQYWYDLGLDTKATTLRVSQYAANFLGAKLRNNSRSFPTPDDAFEHLITRFPISYKPLAAYAGFYCLIEPQAPCDTETMEHLKHKARNWMVIGVLSIVCLVLSLAFGLIMYKFNKDAVKPEPKPVRRARSKGTESQPLNVNQSV